MKTIFVSSTIHDLKDIRAELREFLGKNGFTTLMSEYEDFTQDISQKNSYQKCLDKVTQADIFLLILNTRYGGVKDSPISITHQEFRRALELHKDFICFVRDKTSEDYLSWKKGGRKDSSDGLIFLQGDNWRVLSLLDEVQKSGEGGGALWWKEFSDSVDLKQKLTLKLGINDYSNNYLAQAQMLRALPKLILTCYQSCGNTVGVVIKNIGSSSANDICFNKTTNIVALNEGDSTEIQINIGKDSNSCVDVTYKNLLGASFVSSFEITRQGPGIPTFIESYFGIPK